MEVSAELDLSPSVLVITWMRLDSKTFDSLGTLP